MSGSFTNLVSQAGGVTGALPPAAEPGCCFTVYKKPATFKVDAFALITLKTRTDFPGFLTHPDDTLTDYGIILTIDDFIQTRPGVNVQSVEWGSAGNLIDPYVRDSVANGATGKTGRSLFLATHDIATETPLHLGFGWIAAKITLDNGLVFSAVCMGAKPNPAGLGFQNFASVSMKVSQTQGSEVIFDMVSYQPNKKTVVFATDMEYNESPDVLGFVLVDTPCGQIIQNAAFPQPWNLSQDPTGILGTCNPAATYTQLSVFPMFPNLGDNDVLPIGTDDMTGAPQTYGWVSFIQGGTTFNTSTIFSFD